MERYIAFWVKVGNDSDGIDTYRVFFVGDYCHLYTAQCYVADKGRARIIDRTNGTIYEQLTANGGWREVKLEEQPELAEAVKGING